MSNDGDSVSVELTPPPVVDADTLIDEILAKKGPQKYKDGLSEDNWEEELEQIPLFMSKMPDHIDPEKGAGILALQDLKYQEDNPDSRALAYKEDGNELFKKKKYKDAIAAYTDGLKQGSTDPQIMAVLYCNRAASHYFIGNMRSSILDANQSKSLKPDHIKAYIRGAEANYKLGKHEETILWCEDGLRVDPMNQRLKDLRMKVAQEKKKFERDKRKQGIAERARKAEHKKLLDAIKARHIGLARTPEEAQGYKGDCYNEDNEKDLEHLLGDLHLSGAHPISKPVHLDDQHRLVWPVIFLYPEYGQSEVILEFHEDSRFVDHIQVMFGDESAPWDAERKYTPKRIEVWFEDLLKGEYIQVSIESTLGSVISGSSRYVVVSGTPSFIILSRGSKFKEDFLVRT